MPPTRPSKLRRSLSLNSLGSGCRDLLFPVGLLLEEATAASATSVTSWSFLLYLPLSTPCVEMAPAMDTRLRGVRDGPGDA